MSSISIKGIVIGNLVALGTTLALGIALAVVLAAPYEMEDFEKAAEIMASEMGLAVGVGLTAMVSMGAGYLAARVAGKGELINGLLSSVLAIAVSSYLIIEALACRPDELAIYDLADLAAAPLFGLIGGYLRLQQVRAGRP